MSIDLSLKNIWASWRNFRKGKKCTPELLEFQFYLEKNLFGLWRDLNSGGYRHGGYRKFIVCDNKKREISVSSIRDRVVHRLLYDYLVEIYDKTFIYDAWSCRKRKGLYGCIERVQEFARRNRDGYVWKVDIKKFFDNVDQEKLLSIISMRVKNEVDLGIIKEVIYSYQSKGMPIGNLSSQIFSNIYLNELDRFVKHDLGVKCYLRYGDDFVIFEKDLEILENLRAIVSDFVIGELSLSINPKSDVIIKTRWGLKFLGMVFADGQRFLSRRNKKKIFRNLNLENAASYYGIVENFKYELSVFNFAISEMVLT